MALITTIVLAIPDEDIEKLVAAAYGYGFRTNLPPTSLTGKVQAARWTIERIVNDYVARLDVRPLKGE